MYEQFDETPSVEEYCAMRLRCGLSPKALEAAEAGLMLPYTGGEPRKRHAILALNLRGGGGLEIWQYTERTPAAPSFEPQLGDLGIYILKIKSTDARKKRVHL